MLYEANDDRLILENEFNSTGSGAVDAAWIISDGLKEQQTYTVNVTMQTVTSNSSFGFNFSKHSSGAVKYRIHTFI